MASYADPRLAKVESPEFPIAALLRASRVTTSDRIVLLGAGTAQRGAEALYELGFFNATPAEMPDMGAVLPSGDSIWMFDDPQANRVDGLAAVIARAAASLTSAGTIAVVTNGLRGEGSVLKALAGARLAMLSMLPGAKPGRIMVAVKPCVRRLRARVDLPVAYAPAS